MDNFTLFERLLHAETEDAVERALSESGFMDDEGFWRPLSFENNFAAISNQQSDPSGALVEKIINGIDAVLMAECYARGIDPEGPDAPRTMRAAVEQFFGVRGGRLDKLDASEQTQLADLIQLVAVGSKSNPNYLIIDRGEGQTPSNFPNTFMSLMRSNKIRIPFVQGKYNSGGTGILQFCGTRNYQLVASRRRPGCPRTPDDESADHWGFTVVRRLLPAGGRRSSMYVYLAPNGQVPSFGAEAIRVLPGKSSANHPAPPYARDLQYGTCVKLYDYRWRAKSTLTTEGRYELERFLHAPCLPFRLTETREYQANYYSATLSGGWVSATSTDEDGEGRKLESAEFPAYAELNIPGVGVLPYQMAVFRSGVNPRHVPSGVVFVVNGQVHAPLPADFISRRLKFDYLVGKYGPLLVAVDCTAMDERVREDFFMASRDRVRKNETYTAIEEKLAEALKNHPGLQAINQQRRKQEFESHLSEEAPTEAFQKLLDSDPTLKSLFGVGDSLVTSTGPSERPLFIGRKFPTFFRLAHEPQGGLIKPCPVNRTCRVEFLTDAVNDYFNRGHEPGMITAEPVDLIEYSHLWNGHFEARFRVPWDAKPGDEIKVTVTVTDPERAARNMPFVSNFVLKALPESQDAHGGHGGPNNGRRPTNGTEKRVGLKLPNIKDVRREQWNDYEPAFNEYDAIRIKSDGQDGYDYLVNIDCTFLLSELARTKDEDKPLIKFWFEYGLVLAAIGMIRQQLHSAEAGLSRSDLASSSDDSELLDLDGINRHCSGLARAIIPIIRSLSRGPIPAST